MKFTLVEKITEAKGTKSFVFKPETPVEYLAGQFFYITLPKLNYPDPRGATRHFTLSSSPTENGLLKVTTRIREESGFKKSLDEIKIGESVEGEGPNGTFIIEDDDKNPNIYIAGGIGITPFRSMIKYASDKNLDNLSLYLIYSNSNEEDIAFKKELEDISKSHPNIHVHFIVTNKEGRLDDKGLKNLINDWGLEIENTTFWVVGPPPMVNAMEEILEKININSDHIRTEKFTGY